MAGFLSRRGTPTSRLVSECLQSTSPEQAWLTPAIAVPPALMLPSELMLLWWGWFNPLGPTSCRPITLEIDGTGSSLLLLDVRHPFVSERVVFGAGPTEYWNSHDTPLASLKKLFDANGTSTHRLIPTIPSHVVAVVGEAFSVRCSEQEELFYSVSQLIDGDFEEESLTLRKFWCTPWERTQAEFQQSAKQLPGAAEALRSGRKDEFREIVKRVSGEMSCGPSVSRAVFADCWNLVTNPDHLQSELSQMGAATERAIAFNVERSNVAKPDH